MDYTKNSITSTLPIFFLLTATLILMFSWNHAALKPWFFSQKNNTSNPKSSLLPKDELQIALERASMPNKTLIIAIINKAYVEPHENEYPTMFDLFLEGFWSGEETQPLVEHLLVVSMDKKAHERCKFRRLNCYKLAAGGGDDFSGEKFFMSDEFIEMMWRRTLFLIQVVKRGYNFIFTDTDVIWLRNPFAILSKNQTLDFEISTDRFNGNPSSTNNRINTGFYFIRSNNKTVSFFEKWYESRKNSTGLKEQDVLEKLIRENLLDKLGVNTRFLDTLYFSGFCSDSKDVRLVTTVHANCCRGIGAKVVDLKGVLRDWKGFKKSMENINGTSYNTSNFQWSRHESCKNSWHIKTLG